MHIRPILSALRRHKAGTVLIALQIALTLAIVCNALFIIEQRLAHIAEPTGVDEPNVFAVANLWGKHYTKQQAAANVEEDLVALRQLPSVADASPTNGYPLRGGGWDNFIMMKPDQVERTTDAAVYVGDEHFLNTFGLKLIAGRNFNADEIHDLGYRESYTPPVTIISKTLADRLFPNGDALGKSFYAMSSTPTTIIGIVQTLHRQDVSAWSAPYTGQSLIWPLRTADPMGVFYVVRARPGQLAAAMREAPKALFAVNRMRAFPAKDGLVDYGQIREEAFKSDRGMALLMGIICVVLLAITAAGIIGLTSFWVGQRRRQIGVRRALGATHRDILHYFLTENLLISLGGIAIGTVLAFALNLWLRQTLSLNLLPMTYVLSGMVILVLLGQGAVFAPALRASRVPPIEATRPA